MEDKQRYLYEKKREEIDELRAQLAQEKARAQQKLEEYENQLEELRQQQRDEIEAVEKSQRQTLDSLIGENDKVLSQDLRQRIALETEKLDQIYKSSLQQHKRQHEETCQMVKSQLQTDR